MTYKNLAQVDFEILLKSHVSKHTPHIETIKKFRPDVEVIETCHRWLSSKGVTCHPTDFGLVCRAPRKLFEKLFSARIEPTKHRPGKPKWRFLQNPKPPSEIAQYIEQIEIPALPELF